MRFKIKRNETASFTSNFCDHSFSYPRIENIEVLFENLFLKRVSALFTAIVRY
jgi:hypothetical protein